MNGSSSERRPRSRSPASGTGRPSSSVDSPTIRRPARVAVARVVTVLHSTCRSPADTIGDVAFPTGVLVLAPTPIGQPAGAPPALAPDLAGPDLIAAEDTRRLARLAAALGVDVRGR